MRKSHASITILLAAAIVCSGCVNLNPQALAMANPMIREFLEEHPNAEITVTHYSEQEAESILGDIRSDCGKPAMEPKELYLVKITDPDSGLNSVVWIDSRSMEVECALKSGAVPDCLSHHHKGCDGDYVYWYDSCGNQEDNSEKCSRECMDGRCVAPETSSSVSRSLSKEIVFPGEEVEVTLSVMPGDAEFYAIDEIYPRGWEVSDPGTGSIEHSGHWKNVVISGARDTEFTYSIVAPAEQGTYFFEGECIFEGMDLTSGIAGMQMIEVAPVPK